MSMKGLPQAGGRDEPMVRFVLSIKQSTAARIREIANSMNVSPSELGGIILDIAIKEYDITQHERREERRAKRRASE